MEKEIVQQRPPVGRRHENRDFRLLKFQILKCFRVRWFFNNHFILLQIAY